MDKVHDVFIDVPFFVVIKIFICEVQEHKPIYSNKVNLLDP